MRLQLPTRCLLILSVILFLTTFPILAEDQPPLPRPPAPGASCVADLNQLCLNAYRFAGTITWEDAAMVSHAAKAVFINGDIGYFWFEDPRYPDAILKVLDGCAVNSNFWVFSAGLSDRQYTLTVDDSALANQVQYVNTAASYSTITDTAALVCGISDPVTSTESTELVEGRGPSEPPVGTLVDDRFETRVTWTDFASSTGFGNPVDLTGHANYFWFFSASNPELFLKIVDNTDSSGYYSVIANATTNVEYEIEIIDTCNSQLTKTYTNPLGNTGPIIDLTAFPDTGGCIVFNDGFESGDLSSW